MNTCGASSSHPTTEPSDSPTEYHGADVIVDPERSFGAPIFAHGANRIDDVLAAFKAGETSKLRAQSPACPKPTCSTSCVSPPEQPEDLRLPTLFLDRSVGRIVSLLVSGPPASSSSHWPSATACLLTSM